MKALVVYDSVFGNTEKIAREIGNAIGAGNEAQTVRAADVKDEMLDGIDLLVVGSPTRKFRPTATVVSFLNRLPASRLEGLRAAAFDTRVDLDRIGSPVLRFIINQGGYAARPIAKRLERRGAEIAAELAGFLVENSEGPLKAGELERAATWARHLRWHSRPAISRRPA